MPNPSIALPSTSNFSHPNFTSEDKAKQFHRLLLDMAKDESEKELKTVFRRTADFFRENFFGLTEAQMRARVRECFAEFFDGEEYRALELADIADETGIDKRSLAPVIAKMVAEGILLESRRRRFAEVGEHYNAIYKPAK